MTNSNAQFHGSDLEHVENRYGIDKKEIINFSSNINPLGISEVVKETLSKNIDLIGAYPDRDYTSLRQVISQYIQVDSNHIVVGNGSTELISLFIKCISPQNATIIGPTYSEYEREIYIGGGISRYYPLLEKNDFKIDLDELREYLTLDTDLLVICNPNNPTSTAINNDIMQKILDICKEQNIFVMIDETYVEFADDPNHVSAVKFAEHYTNLFIIRGVSKFFAAPGLRLGYGICGNVETMRKINSLKNPWTINSLAAYAGELMLLDTAYINRTRTLIHDEREKIYNTLSSWDFIKVYAPTANFILAKIQGSHITSTELFETLLAKKMMIRDVSTFPFLGNNYFRFCFLDPEHNDMLLGELKHILS
jgi:threonine-phosphate decarboxylase